MHGKYFVCPLILVNLVNVFTPTADETRIKLHKTIFTIRIRLTREEKKNLTKFRLIQFKTRFIPYCLNDFSFLLFLIDSKKLISKQFVL